ncbi:MAG: T9SS type A sorting domain-containing protein [Candidatus Kapabacteria bacterium]|nr:T9SS type A sorting domain-containing protein [Candidatus Kapabacteria bacterium]
MMNVQNLLLQWYKRTSAPLIVTLLLFVLVGFGTSAYSQSARWVAGADTAATASALVPFNSTITGAVTTGNGDVIVCGQYTGRIDFTLLSGTIVSLPTNVTTVSGRASFVARYDSLGRAIWVRGIDAGIANQALAVGIVFDGTVSPARVMVAVNANAAIVNPIAGAAPLGGFDGFLLGLDTAGVGPGDLAPVNIATAGVGNELITAITSNNATTSANYRIGVVGTYTTATTINGLALPAPAVDPNTRSTFAMTRTNVGAAVASAIAAVNAGTAGEYAVFTGVAFDAPTGVATDSLVAVGYYRSAPVSTINVGTANGTYPVRNAGALIAGASTANTVLPVSTLDDYMLIKVGAVGAVGRISHIATGGSSQNDRATGVAVDATTGNTFVAGIMGEGHTTGAVPITNFTTRTGSLPTTVELTDTAGGGRSDMFLLQYSSLRVPPSASTDLTNEGTAASITPILTSVNTGRGRGDDGATAITLRRRPLAPSISEPIVTGYFSNTTTFSNGPVKKSLTSSTGRDIFVLGFNDVYLWVNSVAGSGVGLTSADSAHDGGNVIAFGSTTGATNLLGGIQSEGRIYVGGTFNQRILVDRFGRSIGNAATPPIELRKVTAGQGHFVSMFNAPSDTANAGVAEIRVNNSVNALFAAGSRPLSLLIKNYGGTRLDSVRVFVEINGSVRDTFLQTFTTPVDPSGEAVVNLPNFTFPEFQNVNIKAWTSFPNGSNFRDKQTSNDTAYFSRGASLNGIVTVGPARNFNTIGSAINYVTRNGVLGPVQFLIADGLYQDRIFINNKIPGSSAVNNIRFESLSGSRLSATLQSPTQTVPELAFTVRIDSCDHVSFARMSINATGNAADLTVTNPGGAAVVLNANTDSISFNDVLVSGVLQTEAQNNTHTTNNINFDNIRINTDNNSNGFMLMNSSIENGSIGVNKTGHISSLFARNFVVNNNQFTTQQSAAVALRNTNSARVFENNIQFPPARDNRIAFNFNDNIDSLRIFKNTIRTPRANAISIATHNSSLTTRAAVYNNMVSVGDGLNADDIAALVVLSSSNVVVAHNTLHSSSTLNTLLNSTSELLTSTNTVFVNNIVYSQGNGTISGPAVRIDNLNTNLRSDYNSYFSRFAGNLFNNNGVGVATIPAWRTATSQDLQSTRNLITTFINPTVGNLRLSLVDTTKDNFTQQFTRELRGTRDTINTVNGPVNVRNLVSLDIDKLTRRYPYKGADEVFTTINIGTNPVDVTVCRLKDTALSVVATINFGSTVGFQWYKDGVPVNSPSATLPQLLINQPTFDSTGVYRVRLVDFITGVADTVWSDSVLFYVLGRPNITPTVTSVNVPDGNTPAALSVVLDGLTAAFNSQPTFRWFKNGVLVSNDANITGATTNVIQFATVRPADVGTYSVIVDGLCGSDTVAGIVLARPTVTAAAADSGTFCVGELVTLTGTKTVSGAAPGSVLTGQWYKDGMPVMGWTSDVVTIDSVLLSQGGAYQFKATLNPGNIEVVSTPINIKVVAPVEILSITGPTAICSDDEAELMVMANSSATTYQWWSDVNGTLTPINGETNQTFKTKNAGTYAVSVVGQCGDTAVSNTWTITVGQLPSFVEVSDDTILSPNSSVLMLRAQATGTEVLLYQWWKVVDSAGVAVLRPIAGEINPMLVRSPFKLADTGTYRVSVTNACGTVVYGQEIKVGIPTSVQAGDEFAFQLGDANPNPFFNETVLNFTIPHQMNVTLDVTDIFGKRVATLLETVLPAGKHSAVFNAEKYGVGAGTYFYNINGDGMKLTRKMMYVK